MTNKEAAEMIRNDIKLHHDYLSGKYRKALNMAIKALEAQEWISVDKKSHPDTPKRVQVQLDNGWIITAYYDENEWLSVPDCGNPIEDRWIEAWKPLPEPYREEDTDVNVKS